MAAEGEEFRAQLRTPKAAAVAGLGFSLLMAASMILMRLSVPADPMGPASDILSHAKTILLALNLVPFAGISFLWFIAVIRDRIGDSEDRFFVTVFLGSGYIFIATLFMSAAVAGAMLKVLGASYSSAVGAGVYLFGRAQMYQATNIYAVKMAGVFMITASTVAMKTRMFPRWLGLVGYALAQVLLWSVGLVEWIAMLFPGWVFVISLYILADNYKKKAEVAS